MKESMACYDACKIGHCCSGGFVNYRPECDVEVKRVKQKLLEIGQYRSVSIVFPPGEGLGLLCKDDSDTTLIPIVNGFIGEPRILI